MSVPSEARKPDPEEREDGSPDVEEKLSAELTEHEDDEEEESSLLDAALGETAEEQDAGLNLLDESGDAVTIEDPVGKLSDRKSKLIIVVFILFKAHLGLTRGRQYYINIHESPTRYCSIIFKAYSG